MFVRCVLLQPESGAISKTEIREYVQNNSSVGPYLKAIKRIVDGFLLLLETPQGKMTVN